MTLFWTKTWDALAGALFPTPCVSCRDLIGAHDPPLCQKCWGRIQPLDDRRCRCGAALPGSPGEDCGRCRRGFSALSRGASLGVYAGPLRDCVIALKYQGRHRTAERLGARVVEDTRCREILKGADLLVGVPLHRDRERERGFNQAELLVRALSRRVSAEVSRSLVRSRNTRSQTDLSARDRRINVAKAFAVGPGLPFRDATVVVIDDVTTTGATLRECAATILAAGAREVRAITVARAE